MDRYNSLSEKQDRKTSSMKAKKHQSSANSDVDYVDYDNENMSPLYSNWDQVSLHQSMHPCHFYIKTSSFFVVVAKIKKKKKFLHIGNS